MKRDVTTYLVMGALVAAVFLLIYSFSFEFTGQVVLEDYTNETDCVDAGYNWEVLTEQDCTTVTTCINETITCEPCLEYEDLNGTQGDCINWTSCIEPSCTDEETCVDVVIGGQCVGNCDSDNLNFCLDETNCTDVGMGYWYNDVCNAEAPSCNNSLSLCLDETNCTDVGVGYWYNDVCNAEAPSCSSVVTLCLDETNCVGVGGGYWYNDVCNVLECASDAHCGSGFECGGTGACVAWAPAEETTTETQDETEQQTLQQTPKGTTKLEGGDIQALSLSAGSSGSVSWTVTNTGTNPLSSCKIRPLGEFASWFSFSEDGVNLNRGKGKEFVFGVLVPEGSEGSYLLSVSLECAETVAAKDFTVDVIASESGAEGTPIGGFAIFGEDGIGTGGVVVLLVVVLALATTLFVARNLRRSGKTLKDVFTDFKFKLRRIRR